MTTLLSEAFDKAAKLPEDLQVQLAKQWIEDMQAESKWEQAFADSQNELAKLGIQKANQLALLLKRGKGDSVKEIPEYWGDASIDEIYSKITKWKAGQQPIAK